MHVTATDTSATEQSAASWPSRHAHRLGPALTLALSITFVIAALDLVPGTLSRPGPGFWPLLVSAVTAALSFAGLFFPRKDEEDFRRSQFVRIGTLLICLAAFPILLDLAGFFIPSILLIVVMMRFLSHESWTKSLLVGVLTSGAAYLVFGVLLGVRLSALPL